jgi:hypothetical protein
LLTKHKKQTNIFVGLSIVFNILGSILKHSFDQDLLGLIVLIVAVASTIFGCVHYAKGKGYSPYWGCLGFLSILGFIFLALLPDKHKNVA